MASEFAKQCVAAKAAWDVEWARTAGRKRAGDEKSTPGPPRKRARITDREDVADAKATTTPTPTPPTWTLRGWCKTLVDAMLADEDDALWSVEVVEGPARPLPSDAKVSWSALVREHLGGGDVTAASSIALDMHRIGASDPRVGLRGQLGVFLPAGATLAKHQFVAMFGGVVLATDELERLVPTAERRRFNAYAFDLHRPAVDGHVGRKGRAVCVSSEPPLGNIAGRINDYRGSAAGVPNVAYGELSVRRGRRTLPLAFVYALRALTGPVELLADYGAAYWGLAS